MILIGVKALSMAGATRLCLFGTFTLFFPSHHRLFSSVSNGCLRGLEVELGQDFVLMVFL